MKKSSLIALVVVIVGFGSIGWVLANNKKEIDSRKIVKEADSKIAVTVSTAEMRATDNLLQLVGTAQANKEVTVAAESAGKIVKINFKLGDYAGKGSILAEVDDTYKVLAYENALLNFDKAEDDFKRYEILHKGDAVTETQLRDAKLGFENAKIQLENAKKQLSDTKIRAPFSGYIISQDTELGAFVNMGTPIAGIADIDQLKISLEVSESNVYKMKTGQLVTVTSSVFQDEEYQGKISNISPKATLAHTYPVEIIISNNKKNPMKAGSYVNVNVNTDKNSEILMIPRDAIVSSIKDPSVYVVENETAQLVKINTGSNFGPYLEVLGGVKEGDLVVTNGQINLTNGVKVAVMTN